MCWYSCSPTVSAAVSAVLILLVLLGGYYLGKVEGMRRKKRAASPADDAAADSPDGMLSQQYEFDVLDRLSTSGGWEVKLECNASENFCRVTAPAGLWNNIKSETTSDGLEFRYTGKTRPTQPMVVEVRTTGLPSLVKGRGGDSILIEKAAGARLKCKVAQSSRVAMDHAKLDEFKLRVSESSRAACGGKFGTADLDDSGSS